MIIAHSSFPLCATPKFINNILMRTFFLAVILFVGLSSSAQYYYKDIIGTRESSETIKNYMKNKVKTVQLTSYNSENQRDEDFYVQQQFSPASRSLITVTRSGITNQSVLISYADANGNVTRTVDSSEIVVTNTNYNYNAMGQLVSVESSSSDTSNNSETEQHLWKWVNNKPVEMLRIKNKIDTAFVEFVMDDNGNVAEERETRKGLKLQPVYYYYNDKNMLTDIVRYSPRAKQLMAEYIFTYGESNELVQKYTIPANSSDYIIWRYQYNPQGLKTKEAIYNKYDKRNPMGVIEYQYSLGL